MRGIFETLKKGVHNIWFYHRRLVYFGFGIILFLFILSFFIDIGYIFTILSVFGLIHFSKIVSKEDPDVLKLETTANEKRETEREQEDIEREQLELIKKELEEELSFLEDYIEKNPTDFVAWRRKSEIAEFLKDF